MKRRYPIGAEYTKAGTHFRGHLGDRLILLNFGPNFTFNPMSEPLIVAAAGLEWEVIWSSESFKYGGEGTPPLYNPFLTLAGHSALVLKYEPIS